MISLFEEYGGLLEVMRCLFALRYGLLSSVPTGCSTRSSTAMGAFMDQRKKHEAVFGRQHSMVFHGSASVKEPLAICPLQVGPPG